MFQGRSSTGPGQPNEIRGTHIVYIGTFSLRSTLVYLLSVWIRKLLKSQRSNVVKHEKLGWFQIGWACPIWIFFQILSCLFWKSPSWWVFLVPLSRWFSKLPGNGRIFFPVPNEGMFSKNQCLEVIFPTWNSPLFRRYLPVPWRCFIDFFWWFRGFGRQASPHRGYSSKRHGGEAMEPPRGYCETWGQKGWKLGGNLLHLLTLSMLKKKKNLSAFVSKTFRIRCWTRFFQDWYIAPWREGESRYGRKCWFHRTMEPRIP